MAGQQRAGILATRAALEQRFEQVAHDRHHTQQRGNRQGQPEAPAFHQRVAERPGPQAGQPDPHHRAQHPGNGAFDGLARTDPRGELTLTEGASGKIRGNVSHPDQRQQRHHKTRAARDEHLRQHGPGGKGGGNGENRPAQAGRRRIRAAADHGGNAAEQPDGGDRGHHIAHHPGRIAPPHASAGKPGRGKHQHAGEQQHGDANGNQGGRRLGQRQAQPLPIGARGGQRQQGNEPPGVRTHHCGGQNGQQDDGGNDTLAQHMTVSSCAALERRACRRLLTARRFR
ncbi:hypothetical protein D3C73_780230 [compost metagenome]